MKRRQTNTTEMTMSQLVVEPNTSESPDIDI
jgi:hypothetical protein